MKIEPGQIWKRPKNDTYSEFFVEVVEIDRNMMKIRYADQRFNKKHVADYTELFDVRVDGFLEDFTPLTKLDYTLL